MKICYCTIRDIYDKWSLSGLDFHMVKSLTDNGDTVIPLIPNKTILKRIVTKLLYQFNRYTRIDFKKNYAMASIIYRKAIERELKGIRPDVLFMPNGAEIIPGLARINLPLVYFSDATFKCMDGYYDNFSHMSPLTKSWYHKLEQTSIDRADAIVYPSQWAAESAMKDYNCPREKLRVISCGGNLQDELVPSQEQILQLQREQQHHTLRILYIGTDWKRKGGDIVLQTFEELRRRAVNCHLTICGDGPDRLRNFPGIDYVGRLNQDIEQERERFHRLYLEASILFVPSRNECFGFIFPEASAFGLPVISTRTGGIPQYVEDGRTGYLLSLDSTYIDYADVIEKLWTDKNTYKELSFESKAKYEAESNWSRWAKRMHDVFDEVNKRN